MWASHEALVSDFKPAIHLRSNIFKRTWQSCLVNLKAFSTLNRRGWLKKGLPTGLLTSIHKCADRGFSGRFSQHISGRYPYSGPALWKPSSWVTGFRASIALPALLPKENFSLSAIQTSQPGSLLLSFWLAMLSLWTPRRSSHRLIFSCLVGWLAAVLNGEAVCSASKLGAWHEFQCQLWLMHSSMCNGRRAG